MELLKKHIGLGLVLLSIGGGYFLFTRGMLEAKYVSSLLVIFFIGIAVQVRDWGMKRYVGLVLMAIGVILMLVLHKTGIAFLNKILIIPFLVLLAGFGIHVWMLKRESKY